MRFEEGVPGGFDFHPTDIDDDGTRMRAPLDNAVPYADFAAAPDQFTPPAPEVVKPVPLPTPPVISKDDLAAKQTAAKVAAVAAAQGTG